MGRRCWLARRSDRHWEKVGEVALGELGPDVGAVACLLDQVRVRVDGHARARVTKDVADLDDVEADVDDQMAREGVAQVVEAHAPSLDIESGVDGGASEHPLGDVVVQERRAVRGREHVVRFGSEAGVSFVLLENRGELGGRVSE
jgi:hypothetical protein